VTLQQGELRIEKPVIISGNGLTIDADQKSRVFYIDAFPVSLNDLTISNGSSSLQGGGINGNNSGISINNCIISGNTAGYIGGGISGTSVTVTNSTVSDNSGQEKGGGLNVFGSLTSINSTIVDNTSNIGGNILTSPGVAVNLKNSIVAGAPKGGDCDFTDGVLIVDDATIIEDGSCNTGRAIDPLLGPLADNGGSTLTHALLPNSPARNTGILADCEAEDQRGQVRDDGDGACDVGAIEFNPNDDFGEAETTFYVIPLPDGKTVAIPL
nr:hypothetical protein [Acidiferrobacterales bacterium]